MKKLRVLGFAWLLALAMVGCGNAESKEQLSSEEQELAEIEEMIVDLLEQRAENEAAAVATAEAENATVEDNTNDNATVETAEDLEIDADNELAERVTAYFMSEELLDNKVADKMNEPTIEKIRKSGKQVKFIKVLCKYEDAWVAKPSLVTDTVKESMYAVSSRQVNDVTDGYFDMYYLSIITCPDDVNYTDFKASWKFYQDTDKEVVEATLTEDIIADDGTMVLDGLEKCNIYNFDGAYYVLCKDFESLDSSTKSGITTNHSGFRFVCVRGDKSQLDFNKFKLDTTFEAAKEMFAKMNYTNLGRFVNREWLCNHGLHPAYDVVAFKGSFEKDVAEAYYVLLADYINDTGYEGENDLVVTYTNNDGEVIDINYYEY